MSTPDVAAAPAEVGAYEPRRSNKTTGARVRADGAVWKERLTVCESVADDGNPKLTIRSYYRNQMTQERVWDEPPSGASEIIFATTEQRKKADSHKHEMQLTLDELPPDAVATSHHSSSSAPSSSDDNNNDITKTPNNKTSKKGIFGRFKKNKELPSLQDESKDLNMQRAIALSVAEANGRPVPYDPDPVTLHDREAMPQDDDVALAKALSISTEQLQPTGMTEEELLQQALEASRLDGQRVPASFDPYAPHAAVTSSSRRGAAAASHADPPPHKMESDEGKKKPGRSMKRRVLGGRKTIANKAGVV